MIDVRELGFSPFVEDYEERGEAIAAELTDGQIEALKELELFRREYFKDLKDFAGQQAAAILRDVPDTNMDQVVLNIAVGTAALALEMSDKFQLQMAEIMIFGERQGEFPEMETTRIIQL